MGESNASPVATKSRAVTALAMINIALGALRVVLSVLAIWLLAGVLLGGPGADTDLLKLLGFMTLVVLWPIFLVIAIISTVAGILLMVAGLGLLRRSRFSRTLTLVMGALGGGLAVLYGMQLISEFGDGAQDLSAMAVSIVGSLVHGGYCALVFVVLLNPRNVAEFA